MNRLQEAAVVLNRVGKLFKRIEFPDLFQEMTATGSYGNEDLADHEFRLWFARFDTPHA